ncbi:uncharacterized protein LOC142994738 [Genypterus blacodes]|uniref:uncharacterized protein LOC142994738 n=1 Tax=Genypterus blacodes TaxID=154954 RepID=UPI003F7676F7
METNERGMIDEEDGSVGVNHDPDPAVPSSINPSQNEGREEQNHDGCLVTSLQVDSAARSRNSKMESKGGDAEDVDGNEEAATNPSTTACMNGSNCNTTGTPNGSKGKDTHGPTCPPPLSAGPCHPGDVLDSFGSQCLDYVSDSQLNSVMFLDEEVVENHGCLGSTECDEDATHLICGLIRELSSVNRTVMVTYRQLENVRRSSKGTKGLHTQRI